MNLTPWKDWVVIGTVPVTKRTLRTQPSSVGCVVCKGWMTMSSMKDAYLRQLRPMDGQQADPPEPKAETAPVHPKQGDLFDVADNRVLCLNLLSPTEYELRRRAQKLG